MRSPAGVAELFGGALTPVGVLGIRRDDRVALHRRPPARTSAGSDGSHSARLRGLDASGLLPSRSAAEP